MSNSATPWTIAYNALLSMGFSRQEYWSGVPLPSLQLKINCTIGKDSDAGKDWGQEKGTTEDEMAGWHYGLDGRESE